MDELKQTLLENVGGFKEFFFITVRTQRNLIFEYNLRPFLFFPIQAITFVFYQ